MMELLRLDPVATIFVSTTVLGGLLSIGAAVVLIIQDRLQ